MLDFYLFNSYFRGISPRRQGKIPLPCMCLIAQLCLTLCDPMDLGPPGSSAPGILQARILEWVAISSPGDLPKPCLLCLLHCKRILSGYPLSHHPKLNRLFLKVMTFWISRQHSRDFNDVPLSSAQGNTTIFSHHPHSSYSLADLCPWTCSEGQVEIGVLTLAITKKFRMIFKANVDARWLKQNTGQNRLEISHIVFIRRHKSRISGSKLACGNLKVKTSSFLPRVESGVFRPSSK